MNEPTPAAKPTPADRKASRPRPQKRPVLPTLLAVVALLVALAALAGSAWTWRQMHGFAGTADQVQNISHLLDQQRRAVADLQQRLTALANSAAKSDQVTGQLNKLAQQTQSTASQLDSRMAQLQDSTGRALTDLRQQVGGRRDSVRIADAAYLLRVARHQAEIRHDRAAMATALTAAQQTLAGLQQPAADSVRRHIAAALQQLKAVPQASPGALARQLTALASNVDDLPLKPPIGAPESASTPPPAQSVQWWQRIGSGLANAFGELVTIRHSQSPAVPLLAPEQRYFLYRNLGLQLDAAGVAALEGDTASFRASLERAHNWLEQYFDTNSHAVQAALAELAQLHDAKFDAPLPDLSAAFAALERLRTQSADASK
ncbi:MAG TPA: uroporphyrinogen-III C-methyltransferase [Gammaproteobacteria bacterium]|nr:uroporphyrinogen-III C-methyltransferase [Gammaproteobacteria bacterium]